LKILKVLIEELLSASGLNQNLTGAAEFGDEEEEANDDDGWEDVPGILDLGLGSTRKELMAFGEGGYSRQPDDETQAYLTEFFIRAGREDLASFGQFYALLTDEERAKLQELASAA
jgi:hypothetical protein